jgi:Pyridoxamine 5'-phosphate oxidase
MLSLDAPVVQEFLRDSLVAHVASRSAAGRVFVTPLWFTPHAGVLWITTGLESRLGRNVASRPEVTLLLWGEARRRRGEALRVQARATRHAGLPPWTVLLRIAARYYLAPRALSSELRNVRRWPLRARYYAQVGGGPGHVRLVPLAAEIVPTP